MEAPQEGAVSETAPQPHNTASGTASMVLGIIGTLLFIAPYFGLPISILAVVLASKQRTCDRKAGEVVLGRTSAGTTLGVLGIVVNSVTSLLVIGVLVAFRHSR
jgi:type IV secretory pathway TrbD component